MIVSLISICQPVAIHFHCAVSNQRFLNMQMLDAQFEFGLWFLLIWTPQVPYRYKPNLLRTNNVVLDEG